MSDILLIGVDLPDCLDLAEGFTPEKKVFTVSKVDSDLSKFESEGIYTAHWNRASAISSRSLILNAETVLDSFNAAVIYFDSYYFGQKFELDRTEDMSMAIDTMISSYQFFLNELLIRLDQKKEKFCIAFIVRTAPSKYECMHSSNKNTNTHGTSNIVNAAQAAFMSLAENTSTCIAEKNYLSVVLGKCDPNNELYSKQKLLGKWISQIIESLNEQKNHQSVKQSGVWNKAGAKLPGGLSLLFNK